MKCADIIAVVKDFGDFSRAFQATGSDALAVAEVEPLLMAAGKMTVAALRKHLDVTKPVLAASESNFQDLAGHVRAAAKFLKAHGKPAVAADLAELTAILDHFGSAGREASIAFAVSTLSTKKQAPSAVVREAVVARYVAQLETALGDNDGFGVVYNALSSDNDVSAAELFEMAKRFAFAGVKSKAAALKKIMTRHQLMMVSRARLDATGGRIAG